MCRRQKRFRDSSLTRIESSTKPPPSSKTNTAKFRKCTSANVRRCRNRSKRNRRSVRARIEGASARLKASQVTWRTWSDLLSSTRSTSTSWSSWCMSKKWEMGKRSSPWSQMKWTRLEKKPQRWNNRQSTIQCSCRGTTWISSSSLRSNEQLLLLLIS